MIKKKKLFNSLYVLWCLSENVKENNMKCKKYINIYITIWSRVFFL
jgi:hypothetical protein